MKQRRTIGLAMNRSTGNTQGHYGNMMIDIKPILLKITKSIKRKTCEILVQVPVAMLEILCANQTQLWMDLNSVVASQGRSNVFFFFVFFLKIMQIKREKREQTFLQNIDVRMFAVVGRTYRSTTLFGKIRTKSCFPLHHIFTSY